VLVPICDSFALSQVGYWNEDEKYVTTASLLIGSNDSGLLNRTYIVTTILVSLSKKEEKEKKLNLLRLKVE